MVSMLFQHVHEANSFFHIDESCSSIQFWTSNLVWYIMFFFVFGVIICYSVLCIILHWCLSFCTRCFHQMLHTWNLFMMKNMAMLSSQSQDCRYMYFTDVGKVFSRKTTIITIYIHSPSQSSKISDHFT
jgi:hypothetical protein